MNQTASEIDRGPVSEWTRIESILSALERVRPILQADGLNLELLDVRERDVRIRLIGRCATCPAGCVLMQTGLEAALREEIHDFGRLQLVFE